MTSPLRYGFKPALILALLALLPSCACSQQVSLQARQSDFKEFVRLFEENYAFLDRPEKPWLTWQARYATAVEHAQTKEALAEVLASALSEAHDFHAEIRSRVPNHWLPVPTFADVWCEFQGRNATVTAVRRGSDAERAGIAPGDSILSVKGVPIEQAVASRLTPEVTQTNPAARNWALLSVVAGRSEEARSITVQHAGSGARTVLLPVERHFDRGPGPLTTSTLPGNVGLIRFNNSIGDQATVAAFDHALQQMRSTSGLVLDLRDVPSGGDSSVALGVMGRFVKTMLPYQRHRIPNYGQADIERNWTEQVAPRGPFTYTAPLVVLVDHWTGSMGEGMAIGFDAMRRATVVGTEMAHLAGSVADFTLPATGITLAFPTEQLFHVDGTPRQNWHPAILVTAPTTAAADPVLQRGLLRLAASQPGHSLPRPRHR